MCIMALRFALCFLVIATFFPITPFWFKARRFPSNHSLSYACCTSRNTIYAVFLSANFFAMSMYVC